MTQQNDYSTCYLSFDFSKTALPDGVEICPESMKNAEQIKTWVKSLDKNPKKFATSSLFLLRELYMQGVKVRYINQISENEAIESFDIYNIGNIELLNRDLVQSEQFLDKEMGLK